jgi:hypothetical protein
MKDNRKTNPFLSRSEGSENRPAPILTHSLALSALGRDLKSERVYFSDPSAIHNSLGVRFLPMLHLVILPLATETKDPSLMHCPSICRPFIGI